MERVEPALVMTMRSYISLCEGIDLEPEKGWLNPEATMDDNVALNESMLVANNKHPIVDDLYGLIDTLTAFMESAGGDYALGVEEGMMRAAEMIEVLIKRHEGN
jgi:hypothetical protein